MAFQAEGKLEWPSRMALKTARELRISGVAEAVGGVLSERRELRRWLHENGLGDLDAEIGGDAELGEGRCCLEQAKAKGVGAQAKGQ